MTQLFGWCLYVFFKGRGRYSAYELISFHPLTNHLIRVSALLEVKLPYEPLGFYAYLIR